MVHQRVDGILEDYDEPADLLEQVYVLIEEMLAFEEEDRPPASECSARLRALSRRCEDLPVDEWAEVNLPPLIRALQVRNTGAEPDPLVGKLVVEDRKLPEPPDDGTEAVAGALKKETLGLAEGDPNERLGRQDDDKWNALKAATMAELQRSRPSPPKPQRVQRRGPPRRGTPTTSPARPAVRIPPSRPRKRRSKRGLWLAALMVSFAAFVILLASTGFVLSWFVDSNGSFEQDLSPTSIPSSAMEAGGGAESIQPVQVDPPAPVKSPGPTERAVPAELRANEAAFISSLEDTKRITVRCGSSSGHGDARAIVADPSGDCTVTAVDRQRRRLVTTVRKVRAREYTCFRDGERSCQ